MIGEGFFQELATSLSAASEIAQVDVSHPISSTQDSSEWIVNYKWPMKSAKLRLYLPPLSDDRPESEFIQASSAAEIIYFHMFPSNHGYGTKLMQSLLSSLQLEGYKFVVLIPKNQRATCFWHKLGFELTPADQRLFLDL